MPTIFSFINPEGLQINRWADSLTPKYMKMVMPDVPVEEFSYAWNALSIKDRKKLFKKFRSKIGKGGVHAIDSTISIFDPTSVCFDYKREHPVTPESRWYKDLKKEYKIIIYRNKTGKEPGYRFSLPVWFRHLPRLEQKEIKSKYIIDGTRKN